MPASQGVQVRLTSLPLTAKPGVHLQVSLPAELELPAGHGVHSLAPGRLNVLGPHSTVLARGIRAITCGEDCACWDDQ